ncbi:MAG: hypothetical protein JWL93_67 [Hyphomicrobiales bacterium]|jgi:hypothetical protein|nr:hypothetical protein [Hyphomicrobiales bacterium]
MLLFLLRLFLIAALLMGARIVAGLFIDPQHMATFDEGVRRAFRLALALAALTIAVLAIAYLASRVFGAA